MAELTFNDSGFENDVLKNAQPVVIDFWAPWCAPCRIVSPIIEELAEDYEGKVVVGKMNVDENPQTAMRYGVMSIPTIMVFKNGKPLRSVIGAQSKENYQKAIDESLR